MVGAHVRVAARRRRASRRRRSAWTRRDRRRGLGFARAFANSIDAVSDRDFVQEFLAVTAIVATHAVAAGRRPRAAGPIPRSDGPALDEAYATGSSMMPQKRNPDTAELARGKAARVAGDFVVADRAAAGPAARLPPRSPGGQGARVRRGRHAGAGAARRSTGASRRCAFDADAMRAACADEGLYATDLAEALVASGVPFREAHRRTGELLKRARDARARAARPQPRRSGHAFGVPERRRAARPRRRVAARPRPRRAVARVGRRPGGRDRGPAEGSAR